MSHKRPGWSPADEARLAAMPKEVNSEDLIAAFPGRTASAVRQKRRDLKLDATAAITPVSDVGLDELCHRVLELARKGTHTVSALADALDRGPATIQSSITTLQEHGYRLALDIESHVAVSIPRPAGWTPIPMEHFTNGSNIVFGVLSDPHIGNRHERLDIVYAAYDYFESRGIKAVFIPGNWIDGEARFNKNELIVAPGFERQVTRFLDVWPHKPGITTYILDGDDHEGWYAQREGIEIGRRLIQSARDRGRTDLEYIGYQEADVPMYGVPKADGGRPAIVRFVHPKGGSSYSISYKPQKIVESYEGGEKPSVLVVGHFHKAGHFVFRNCQCVLAGCAESQTGFMRGKQLAAHTGFYVIDMQVDKEGVVTRFLPDWHPFFNEGYYQDRYPIGDIEETRVA